MIKYKYPTILIKFHISTFENYDPSGVTIETDFTDGGEGEDIKPLTMFEQLRFLELSYEELLKEYIKAKVKYEDGKR
mgnify:CR=1 FL=1